MFGKLLILLCLLALALGYMAHGSSGAGLRHTYVVKAGDTLWSIAAKNYAGDPREGVWEIQQRNHLGSATISPGEKLLLP
jgi:LysM repeat protein